MGVMPANVAKGPILKRIDELSNDKTRFQNAFTELQTNPDLIFLGKKYDILKPDPLGKPKEEDHVKKLWFQNWWLQHQPLAPVARAGLLKAMELSINESKPLDCYWVCAGTHFELVTTLSEKQVTLLVLTPPPPVSYANFKYNKAPDEYDPIWVTKHASVGVCDGEVAEAPTVSVAGVVTTHLRTGPHQ